MLAVSFGATDQMPLTNDTARRLITFITANGPNMSVAINKDAGMTVDSLPPTFAQLPAAAKSNTVMLAVIGGAGLLAGLLLGRLTK
jgi:hypothetical protein